MLAIIVAFTSAVRWRQTPPPPAPTSLYPSVVSQGLVTTKDTPNHWGERSWSFSSADRRHPSIIGHLSHRLDSLESNPGSSMLLAELPETVDTFMIDRIVSGALLDAPDSEAECGALLHEMKLSERCSQPHERLRSWSPRVRHESPSRLAVYADVEA